ncbi:MAG: polysaccharide pyruvyl transferase family protein, partial [Cyclobacteriaceae bacterium]
MNQAITHEPLSVLLRGYYGWGNFGDDLLMVISFRLLREWFPAARISISTSSDRAGYIQNLIGEEVPIHPFGSGGHFDLVFRGGGGVFFDFKPGSPANYVMNKVIRGLGVRKTARLLNGIKAKAGKSPLSATYRCGLGIGVGTYTPDSAKYYYSATELSLQDLLLVRDEKSRLNALDIEPGLQVHTYTDLAFLRKYWVPDCNTTARNDTETLSVGFVLRDWQADNSAYLDKFRLLIDSLKSENIRCRIVILDKEGDKITQQKFDKEDMLVWDPSHMDIRAFAEALSDFSLIISSRAHGAIGGACLNVPVMCYPIEPKLKRVREMLGEAAIEFEPSGQQQATLFRDYLQQYAQKAEVTGAE